MPLQRIAPVGLSPRAASLAALRSAATKERPSRALSLVSGRRSRPCALASRVEQDQACRL